MPIKFVGEPFSVSKEFWYRKFSSKGGGSFTVLSKIFLSHRTEKTSPVNHSVSENFWSGKILWIRGGVSRFPVEKFFSHCTEIFHLRTIWCFKKILLSKIFMHRRGGGASRFCRNFFSHRTETKSFVKEPFCFPEIFWYRKNLWIRGGISRFSVKIFMSHSAKNFRKGILLFLRKFLVSISFFDEKGGITFFRRKILLSQCRKISWASLQCFRKFGVSKSFMHNRGYHNFPLKMFCLTVPKNIVKEPFSVSLFSGIKKC